MSNFKLCPGDPLVNTLRSVFKANIIRIPRKRVQPLTVMARKGRNVKVLGDLQALLLDDKPLNLSVLQEPMSPIEGNRSQQVDFGFGVKILEGYLSAFGLPAGGVTQAFSKVKSVSFGFEAMQEVYVDPLRIGRELTERQIDVKNPALNVFSKDDDYELLVVDTVYASNAFSLHFDGQTTNDLEVDVPALEGLLELSDVKLKVDLKNKRAIEFKGKDMMSFAFTCVRMYLDWEKSCILAIDPHSDYVMLEKSALERPVVAEEPEMLDLE